MCSTPKAIGSRTTGDESSCATCAWAFWTAPVLWRFETMYPRQAPEDWRSPKPADQTNTADYEGFCFPHSAAPLANSSWETSFLCVATLQRCPKGSWNLP